MLPFRRKCGPTKANSTRVYRVQGLGSREPGGVVAELMNMVLLLREEAK